MDRISRAESGRVKTFLNLAGRVKAGQEFFANLMGRVRSGRVKSFLNLTDRFGSRGNESSRVGSGHDPRETGHSQIGPT